MDLAAARPGRIKYELDSHRRPVRPIGRLTDGYRVQSHEIGDPLIVGSTNYAGGAATRLSATASGGAFWMTQNGYGSAVKGDSTNGHGAVFSTAHQDRF